MHPDLFRGLRPEALTPWQPRPPQPDGNSARRSAPRAERDPGTDSQAQSAPKRATSPLDAPLADSPSGVAPKTITLPDGSALTVSASHRLDLSRVDEPRAVVIVHTRRGPIEIPLSY